MGTSGAQHGTSGNNSDRLREIANQTRTTKANVATALQMISWGLEVNDYGNAILDENGDFIKVAGQGADEDVIRLPQNIEFFPGDDPRTADGQSRSGKGLTPDQVVIQSQGLAQFAHFILKQIL